MEEAIMKVILQTLVNLQTDSVASVGIKPLLLE
jgi:hypothetical protein